MTMLHTMASDDPVRPASIPGVRRRGRPKKTVPTVSVQVRMSQRVFDAYCAVAMRAGQPVSVVLRHVITMHAPGHAT